MFGIKTSELNLTIWRWFFYEQLSVVFTKTLLYLCVHTPVWACLTQACSLMVSLRGSS